MAKDLSGTNIAVQKESAYYAPIFLVELVRDHPETGESSYRISTWSGTYTVGGNDYLDRILSIDAVRQSIAPGGGLANVGDWRLSLLNPTDLPANRRLSDMLDDYFLENDEVRLSAIFKTGTEGADDVLRLFTGLVQDARITTKEFRLSAKDGSRSTLRDVPQEFLDRIRWVDAPLNVQDVPYPVPFGNMNVEPFNTSGTDPSLAPCICVDIFDAKYTAGLYCKTYGQPYVYYRSARFYARIEDYTQSGEFFTIDSASRFTKIIPMRPASTNDVSNWKNVADRNSSTDVDLISGDNLDLKMRGSPKLGTATGVDIVIEGSGSNVDYTITKTGEADVSGTTAGFPATIDLDGAGWDFSDDWDFENIEVKIDGPAAATTSIWSITLDLTFDEQETGDRLAFPVFQAVTGYEDVATQYQDGAVIVSNGQLLRNPVHVALALMRDRRTGMRMEAAQIDTTNVVAEVAKISDWYFDFSMTDAMTVDGFSEMLRQGKVRQFRTYDNKWKVSVFDKTDDSVAAFFDDTNIAVKNPDAPPNKRESSVEVYQAPLSEVYNEIVVDYGWNPALATFTKQTVATHHYTVTGTATLDKAAGTLTDLSATFQTDGIQVGYNCFVVRDKLYTVDAVNSETELEISPADPTKAMSSRSDTYYIGPNYNYLCHRSLLKYKAPNRLRIGSTFIQDDDTADALRDFLVEYYTPRPLMARFRTFLNAVDVELGDLAILDSADLPAGKRPADLGTIGATATKVATTITLADTGAALTRIDDRLVVRPAGGRLYRECWKATDRDAVAGTIDVTRGYSGTTARGWNVGDIVQRVVAKWEVVDIQTIPGAEPPQIEITVRETPRDYTPVGHAAPSGTPSWADATPEERALYGYASFPNGEIVWLDEDSANSYARTP